MTGSFAGKGKLACWKAFLEADSVCVDALERLGGTSQPPPTKAALKQAILRAHYQAMV